MAELCNISHPILMGLGELPRWFSPGNFPPVISPLTLKAS